MLGRLNCIVSVQQFLHMTFMGTNLCELFETTDFRRTDGVLESKSVKILRCSGVCRFHPLIAEEAMEQTNI